MKFHLSSARSYNSIEQPSPSPLFLLLNKWQKTVVNDCDDDDADEAFADVADNHQADTQGKGGGEKDAHAVELINLSTEVAAHVFPSTFPHSRFHSRGDAANLFSPHRKCRFF